MKIWERQAEESEKAFAAFQVYLEMEDRSPQKVAEKLQKDRSLITRWAAKFDWRNRAVAWDNSILEDKRRAYIKRYNKFLDKQFKGNERIQELALKVFEEKNMAQISWKSLNEIYRSNFTEMTELSKQLGFATTTDSEITINIQRAEEPAEDSEQ